MKRVLLILILLLIPLVYAKEGHMTLLAVSETREGMVGSTADIYLEIKPGSGKVFIETYPLSKVDTQISTRFAKEIACDMLNYDCYSYDFFYTIKAESSIIAGPSAGGSIAVLTVALLDDQKISETTAITGTINSGGLIGPVGGVKAKIEAAKKKGLMKVLIPAGEREKENNKTIDLVEYGKSIGIQVFEVNTLEESLYIFTSKNYSKETSEIEVDDFYTKKMLMIAEELCERNNKLIANVTPTNESYYRSAINASASSVKALIEKKYYSAASFCFGSNIKLTYLLNKNVSLDIIEKDIKKKSQEIEDYNKRLKLDNVTSIIDFQTYIIVKERVLDSINSINKAKNSVDPRYDLFYGIERFESAKAWALFFGKDGAKIKIDNNLLYDACIEKMGEAEERMAYVSLFTLIKLEGTEHSISEARNYLNNQDYPMCLFSASKAKAEADVVIGLMGYTMNDTTKLLNQKVLLAQKSIDKQAMKGNFPILGYSYYEYAKSLAESDKSSALLYSEYAIELSNIDIYLKKPEKQTKLDLTPYALIMLGILIGVVLTFRKTQRNRKAITKIR